MELSQDTQRFSNGSKVLSALGREALVVGALAAIVAIALGLRLYGVDWDRGFSYTPHPDERAILMKVAEISPPTPGKLDLLLDADRSPWNPRWFPYGSFPLYMLKGVQLVSSLGPGDGLQDLRYAGRAISALADVATVVLVFALGSRLYGLRVGLLASALVALAVVHIQLSHFFAVDTLLALFALAAVYFLFRVAREGRLGDSLLAGAFVGLGLATKVSLAPIYAAFLMAHLMYAFSLSGGSAGEAIPSRQRRASAIKGLAAGVAASLLVLFVVQPYTFLDWSRFFSDVVEQSEMVRRIRDYPYTRQYVDTVPYWYHVRQLATWGLGWPLGVVAWAGLLYASLRGMRTKYGLAYLALGWGLPIAILLFSTSFLAIIAASGIAMLALLATLPLRSEESRMDVLLLSWAVPMFLISGAFQVKFLRYLLPITPFLLLFGSRMLFALWDRASKLWPALRPWLVAGLVGLLVSTGFYALSYVAMFREPHAAVRAAQWISQNVPKGSIVLKEHWEEGLPGLQDYVYGTPETELRLYEEDSPQKVRELTERLARADYLVLYSNRLYGTIPRLTDRYPVGASYYRALLADGLGYELVDVEATYPELSGVAFVDDTFRRPGLPEPAAMRAFRPAPVSLNLGFADESFSVYDHPKVMVFKNVGRHDAERLRRTIEGAATGRAPTPQSAPAQAIGLMLSPQDAAAQQRGGTWADIVLADSWTNRFPVLAWLIVVEGISLLALPIALLVFRPLPDRGFLFSKALGLLAVALVAWLLASGHWMAFSRGSIAVSVLLLSGSSVLIVALRRRELAAFLKERWPVLLIGEAVFLAAFFSFLMLRMANPDLWHPWRGGEKPMDMAYLNAVLRSTYMPPYDPWFAGGYLNYYYWGQFMVAVLIRATGIDPAVAFNLAVPTFFALTASGAFALVYNLAEGTRRALHGARPNPSNLSMVRQALPRHIGDPDRSGDERSIIGHHEREAESTLREGGPLPTLPSTGSGRAEREGLRWSPVLAGPVVAGIGGALFVTVLGNLDGAIQVGQGVWRAAVEGRTFGEFDFWRSSRMMPSDLQGITEFPFFTFLFADLHAHMMALPFTLLALGVALSVVVGAAQSLRRRTRWHMEEIVRLAVLGLVVGALRLVNTWDFPTYLLVGVAAVFLAEYFARGGLSFSVIFIAGLKCLFVFLVGYLAFLPFHLTNEGFFDSVERTTHTTILWRFLGVGGLFIFIVGSFFVSEARDWLAAAWRSLRRAYGALVEGVAATDLEASTMSRPRIGSEWVVALLLGALLVGYALTAVFSSRGLGSTIPFAAIVLALVVGAGFRWVWASRPDAPQLAFVAVMVSLSLAIVMGLDVFRVAGDIDRMNSVFKLYLQVWVMLGLTSAYLLWRLAQGRRVPLRRLAWRKRAWLGALAVLVVGASVYPVLGTQDRLRDRFDSPELPLTLDGAAYIRGTVYRDEKGAIDLEADFEGIRWLRENVEGSPVVLEGVTPTYRWGGRITVYTGLPSVVGWQWHQEQQRWGYRWEVGKRIGDVNAIYRTANASEALALLRKYGVRYVFVGQLERLYYPDEGLRKFEGALGNDLEKVFQGGQVTIYRLRGAGG